MRQKKRKRKNKLKIPIIISFILILLFSVSQLVAFIFIPPNLQVHNIDLGMIKKNQVDSVLKNTLSTFEANEVEIIYDEQTEKFSLSDLGISFEKEKLKKEIITASKSNILNFVNTAKKGRNFEPSSIGNNEIFYNTLEVFNDDEIKKPINAYYKFQQGKVTIVDGEPGYVQKKDELLENLLIDPLKNNLKLTLDLELIEPEITSEILREQGINEIVSSYETTFNPKNTSRTTNIQLAVDAINGTILAPNEVFSFNDTVGQRTAAKGYQNATIFLKGEPVDGIGGGICQVSTTLYNAVLLGDYEVVTRRNHSINVSYVELSRDATVSWGSQDLIFKNQTDKYLYIHGSVQANKVIFNIHSTKIPNKKIVLESVLISKEPNKYKSKLIKKTYYNNALNSTSLVSTDTYIPSSSLNNESNDFEKIVENENIAQ